MLKLRLGGAAPGPALTGTEGSFRVKFKFTGPTPGQAIQAAVGRPGPMFLTKNKN